MDFLSNNSLLLMERSMGFLWTKQAAILDNIANAETPNYKAKTVTFEEELRERLESARKSHTPKQSVREELQAASVQVHEPAEATRMDDNGVNVTEQSTELVRNSFQLQYVMQSINSNLAVLRSVARGQ